MSPSTWPALIVGVFTILQPPTAVAPTTAETGASPAAITATPVAIDPNLLLGQSYSIAPNGELLTGDAGTGTVTIPAPTTVAGIGADGKSYSYTIDPTAPGTALLTPTQIQGSSLTSIDHMPNCWPGGDPNKMDAMAVWDGTDPNNIDHMAFGYDPKLVTFYNSGTGQPFSISTDKQSSTSVAPGDWDKYFKNWSLSTPPAPPAVPKVAPMVPAVPSVPAPKP